MISPLPLQNVALHADTLVDIARTLASDGGDEAHGDILFWSNALHRCVESWRVDLKQADDTTLKERLLTLETTAGSMAEAMEFGFLLDPQRRLLSIGYRAADGTLDPSCYDLLASEARLASFVAIAKGDVATRHWFRLGRPVTAVEYGAALISWSGSMFEYLMPSLVMRAPAGSLLEQTSRLIVRRQVSYGATLDLPWGISESAYNARDLELTYQYSNFGVPGLGLKRGLSENAVVAPYATALAAMVEPELATRNLARLASLGTLGRYGFYEALDYTPSRLPEGMQFAIVRAFMAHHQGMTIVAIANVLLHGIMRKRFHAEPQVQAAELLLQERTPRDISVAHPRAEEVHAAPRIDELSLPDMRRLHSANDATPQVHLLSNGRYAVMITAAGSGYSRWRDLGITRWREDVTRDDTGSYIFLRDMESGRVWSAGYQPCGVEPDHYEATFAEDSAELVRTDSGITTTLKIIVSPEDDAEVRHLSITNTSSRMQDIEVTSYCELVLAPPAADSAHPAFSKLFVQTEYVARLGALLATRRKRSPGEPEIWVAHQAVVEGEELGALEIETDRARFLGRGNEVRTPIAVMDGRRLSNTVGAVLDPIFALRYRVRVAVRRNGAHCVLDVRRGLARARARSHRQARQPPTRSCAPARSHGRRRRCSCVTWASLRRKPICSNDWRGTCCSRTRHCGHRRTPSVAAVVGPRRSGAKAFPATCRSSCSGSTMSKTSAIARQLLQAHEYWRMKQLAVDLVILNERAASYVQDLQVALATLHRTSQARGQIAADGARGSVFILRADLIPDATRRHTLLGGSRRARRASVGASRISSIVLASSWRPACGAYRAQSLVGDGVATGPAPGQLEFFNGLGGFAENGREYVTLLGPAQSTPAPWINVIANPTFGFQVAAEGSGYTWSLNSRENQLTPWSNDPVTDRPGRSHLRARRRNRRAVGTDRGAHPRSAARSTAARHGQGYSRFEHESHGIALDLLMYVPLEDPIKISRLEIRNTSARARRLSITAYVRVGARCIARRLRPVHRDRDRCGDRRDVRAQPLERSVGSTSRVRRPGRPTNELDARTGANSWGATARSQSLRRCCGTGPLSKRVGAGLDPCGALQTAVELEPGDTAEVVFFLGEAADAASAQALLRALSVRGPRGGLSQRGRALGARSSAPSR